MSELDKRDKRYGFFGGAFDPPHYGHLFAGVYALSALSLDKLFVVPSLIHPLKKAIKASYWSRVDMLRLLFENIKNIEISEIEYRAFENKEEAYTVDVIESMKKFYAGIWYLIIGSDESRLLSQWHDSDRLNKISTPFIVPRGPSKVDDGFHVHDISSTILRSLPVFRLGLFTSPKVKDYISKNMLYGDRK